MLILNNEDEKYKERLERARKLRNSVGMVTGNDLTDTSSNNYMQTSIDYNDYQNKLNRAKKLRNSVGMVTSQDLNNNSNIVENNPTDYLEDEKEMSEKVETTLKEDEENISNKVSEDKKQDTFKLDEAELNKLKKASVATVNPSNKTLRENMSNNNIANLASNTKLSSNSDASNMTMVSASDIDAMGEAEQRNQKIEKGGTDAFNARVTTILNNISGGAMQAVAGLANVVTTAGALGVRGLEAWANIFGQKENAKKLNELYYNILDTGTNIKNKGEYESNITARIEDTATRRLGQVTNTVSEMATSQFVGFAFGLPGTVVQGLTVGGRSAQEVLDENPDNITRATITGIAKGYTSYLTEKMFDANILTKGQGSSISNKVDDLIFKYVKNKYGREFLNKTVGIVGENLEEHIENIVDYTIDKIVNDKDFPTIQQLISEADETTIITTFSTIVMDLLGLGGGNFESKTVDILTRKAQKIIDNGGYAIQYNPDATINNTDIDTFYTTKFDQSGEVQEISKTQGKTIENPNKKVNVKPVIIKNINQNAYNIIDSNTGVILDSTPYNTLIQAQAEFDSKMINLDEASIKGINSKVNQANTAINNKIMEVVTQAENELKVKANSNASQNVQNQFSDNSNVKTANDMSNSKNTFKEQNSKIRTYEKEIETYKNNSAKKNIINKNNILEINTNIFENVSKNKQGNILNEYLKNEVKGKDYYVDGQKIISNGTTIGKLKNGKTNFDKRIDANIRNELKANVITNLDNVIANSKIYQADLKDTKNHTFADTFDRRKSIINYKGQNYEVMFEIGKKNGRNTLYSIEKIKKTSFPTQIKKDLRNTQKGMRDY